MSGGDDDEARWSFAAGPHGYRVRVRERKRGGNVYLYSYDDELGGNRKTSLGYPVRDADGELLEEAVEKAKAAAAEASNALIRGASPHEREDDATTLGELFEAFRREEAADMSGRHRTSVLRELELLERFLGADFEVDGLGLREWNAIRRARASGEIDPRGHRVPEKADRREVGPRTVAKTLKVLRQACKFGENYRTAGGGYLVEKDPTRGLDLPREKDPNRPVCSDELLSRLLEAAPEVRMGHATAGEEGDRERSYLLELLILAAETGARIGEIVRLRWSDWSPEEATHGTITWRGENQKSGRTRVTPVTSRVREALREHRRRRPGVGEAWVFPAPESKGHVRVDVALRWWREAEAEAPGVEHEKGMGFHALRRRWANRMKDRSPVDAAALGGWADVSTMQRVYQEADLEGMERALLDGEDGDDRKKAGGGRP